MEIRRDPPPNFNIEVNKEKSEEISLNVLDLRSLKAKKKKKRKRNRTREIVFRELAGIESRDVELASSLGISLTAPEQVFPPEAQQRPDPDVPWGLGEVDGARGEEEYLAMVSRFAPTAAREEVLEFAPELVPPPASLSRPVSDSAERALGEAGQKRDASLSSGLRTIRGFALLAGGIAIILLGSFFFQKILNLKSEGVARSMDAYAYLRDAEHALTSLDFEGASSDFAQAYASLAAAEGALQEIGGLTVSIVQNLPLDPKPASSIALLRTAKHVAKAGEMVSSALATLSPSDPAQPGGALSVKGFLEVLLPDGGAEQSGQLLVAFGAFEQTLAAAEGELALAQIQIERVNPDDFPDEFQEHIRGLSRKIPTLATLTRTLKDYVRIASFLLGDETPKRYLILFQNSSELRPTGGFIGSYALLEVAGGKIQHMFVEGIYNIDGQLTVNVVPPKPFQHIATAWSTHDANWFLDFPTSAEKIMWFYERTGGGKVDGVVTLNVEVIEQLLELTGPIALPGYDLTLDAQNFRDEIQYEVEVAYDKKLNRPKQVLADFTPPFLEQLGRVAQTQQAELASLILRALEEKYTMLYFKDPNVQEFFENQGWTGSIPQQDNDYLAVVHSNIGGYKTDKFMQSSVDYDVTIQEDGSMLARVTVTRVHTGGESSYWWYNRPNIDYVKIYVPRGSQILSYTGGERREVTKPADYAALGFSQDPDVSAMESAARRHGAIDIFSESGQTVFGTWLVTRAQHTTQFELSYKLPFRIEFQNDVAKYNLYIQKQPGTSVSMNLAIHAPAHWDIAWDNSGENDLTKSFALDTDKVIGYIFKK